MIKNTVLFALSFILLLFSACKKETTETFPILPVLADTLVLNGLVSTELGENAGYSVFVDLSKSVQTSVRRTSWDLALYTGSDFRVILNHSTGATAIQLDKNSILDISDADTTALVTGSKLVLGNSTTTVDPFTGIFADYLSGNVLGEVSATDADNKVFIINRGLAGMTGDLSARTGWRKFRILRSGNGYAIQKGKIDDPSFTPVYITKNPSFNFVYYSFDQASVVTVEPSIKLWDIEWTYSTYKTAAGDAVGTPDFVLINFAGGVEAAEVKITDELSYQNFSESDLTSITWSAQRDVIGTNWRVINGSASTVNRDRFYLIKDIDGNIYKLRFNSFIPRDGGVRGKPNIDYILVKAAE